MTALVGSVGSTDVTLLGPRDHAVVATLRIDYLVVTAFVPPATAPSRRPVWAEVRVIGHRGSGAERAALVPGRGYRTHVRENTVLSFNVAADHGIECVEFGTAQSQVSTTDATTLTAPAVPAVCVCTGPTQRCASNA